MKKLIFSFAFFLALKLVPSAYGQIPPFLPDSRDSVIIESKTVYAGVGAPRAVVRVYITNKDTLAAYELSLMQYSLPGGAYMTLSHPRSFTGVVNPLTTTLQFEKIFAGYYYNSGSADTFFIAGLYDPNDVSTTAEPPNLTRKPLLEIKFDSVRLSNLSISDSLLNSVWFDSALSIRDIFINGTKWGFRLNYLHFLDRRGNVIPVNFVKGRIRVLEPDLIPPSVTVTDPNGGEAVSKSPCPPYTVTWTASDNVGVTGIEIRLDRTNDGVFEQQIANLSSNPGSYNWTVGGSTSNNAKIKIIATDGAGNSTADVSDGTFSIITNCIAAPPAGPDLNEDGVLSLVDAILLIKSVHSKKDGNSINLSKAYIDSMLTAIFSGSP